MDYGKIVAEALDEVAAEIGQPLTDLQRHDAKYHPNGYWKGYRCKYRERMAQGDLSDAIDPENVEGEAEEIAAARAERKARQKAESEKKKSDNENRRKKITHDTMLELTRAYTEDEIASVEEAMRYAFGGKCAFQVGKKEAREALDSLIGHSSNPKCRKSMQRFYDSYGRKVEFNGIGEVEITNHSIGSALSHSHHKIGNRFSLYDIAALTHLREIGKSCMPTIRMEKWKRRSYGTITVVCPFNVGESENLCELILTVQDNGRIQINSVKNLDIKRLREHLLQNHKNLVAKYSLAGQADDAPQQLPLYQNSVLGVNRARQRRMRSK